jgi:hypothetical protein
MSCNAASDSDYHSKEKVLLLVTAAGDWVEVPAAVFAIGTVPLSPI